MKKNNCMPVIRELYLVPQRNFSFIAKEGKLKYFVYDIIGSFCKKRQLASKDGDVSDIKLYQEVISYYTSSYKKVGDTKIEVWDPDVVEYEDVELPLYRKNNDGSFTYMRMSTLVKGVPTQKMVKASKKYLSKIDENVKIEGIKGEVEFNIKNGCDGVSTILKRACSIEKLLDENEYYTFVLKKPYKYVSKYETLIIKRSNILDKLKNGRLEILVPKEYVGIAIGKGGRCAKKMAEDLKVNFVDIKAYN